MKNTLVHHDQPEVWGGGHLHCTDFMLHQNEPGISGLGCFLVALPLPFSLGGNIPHLFLLSSALLRYRVCTKHLLACFADQQY